jgi:sugar/nucleoside kinase (ribokinase family)
VSADEAGVAFLEDFEKRGISLCCPPFNKETEPSAICLALVTGENRSFAVDPGCSDCFSDDDFNKFDFSSTHSLLIEGFQLTSPLAGRAISKTIEKAKEDAKIAINLQGMRNWCEVPDLVNKVSSLADIIIGNSQEQTVFQGAAKMFEPCCKEDQLLITTKGSEGAELFQADTLTRYTVIARAPKVFVIPMGAGDAFAAGFLLAQSRKLTLQKSMCLAAKTATAVLEEESARPTRSLSYLFLGHGLLEQNK